jgi:hypothetical protein
MKRIAVTADEKDAYDSRRHIVWARGEIRSIKTSTHRRERREGKLEIREALAD